MTHLNPRQLIFCNEFLIDLNATQAALRSGYSKNSARSIGQENLTKPDIQDYISVLKKERAERTQISSDSVLQELAKIAFASIEDFISWDSTKASIKDSKTLTGHSSAILTLETDGSAVKIKLKDSLKALELLGKHLGLFDGSKNNSSAHSKSLIQERLGQLLEKNLKT